MSETLASPQHAEQSIPVQAVSGSSPVAVSEPLSLSERFDRIRAAIERRAFELFMDDGAVDGRDLDHWSRAEAELLHPTHLGITESDTSLIAKAELPGYKANELQVSLSPSRLTIAGRRESSSENKGEKMVYQEHCASEIFRSADLPAEVDVSRATATLNNGVLELVMPKASGANTGQSQVKAASAGSAA